MPGDAAEPTWLVSQQLGMRPATPADAEAWRRDGSPTSFAAPGAKCVIKRFSCEIPRMMAPKATKMPESY